MNKLTFIKIAVLLTIVFATIMCNAQYYSSYSHYHYSAYNSEPDFERMKIRFFSDIFRRDSEKRIFGASVMGLPLSLNSWGEGASNGLIQIDFLPLDFYKGSTSINPKLPLNSSYHGVQTSGYIPSAKESVISFVGGLSYWDIDYIGNVYGYTIKKEFEYRSYSFTLFRLHFLRDSYFLNFSVGFSIYEEQIEGSIYDDSHNTIGWSNDLHQDRIDYGFIQKYRGYGVDFQIGCFDFRYYHTDYSDTFFVSVGYSFSNILYWLVVKSDGVI